MTANALNPIGDTTLRSGAQFANDGTDTALGITAVSAADVKRTVLKFSQPQIAAAIPSGNVLYSARLDLTQTGISAGWLGGAVDIFRMNRTWEEGTGTAARAHGASWVCADDSDTTLTGNLVNNCTAANGWSMLPGGSFAQPFVTQATDRSALFTNGLTLVSFDVSADVQAFLNGTPNYGWMLGAALTPLGGQFVNFGSRESSNKPQLVLQYGPDQCPTDPNKGLPGSCGCGQPDLDVNLDHVPDCFAGNAVVTGDTTLNTVQPFSNLGADPWITVTSASVVNLQRALVSVDTNAIDMARKGLDIKHAYLELTIAGISAGWAGGQVGAFRMTHGWAEGDDVHHGATWACADDTNTSGLNGFLNDCTSANVWSMPLLGNGSGPYATAPTATVGISFPGPDTVRLDVSADVKAWINDPTGATTPNDGWLLQGVPSNLLSGSWVNFGSRESGAPPRLLLDLDTSCPAGGQGDFDHDGVRDCQDLCMVDPNKTTPGACGCGKPDTDSDHDSLPDCIDPCPVDGDATLGGECGCPSGMRNTPQQLAASGTECSGPCGGVGSASGVDVCDGAGHCGNVNSCAPVAGCACTALRTTTNVYWFCPCAKDAITARAACESVEGESLPEIDDVSDNAFIRARIQGETWLGASDQAVEGTWRWSSSSAGTEFWQGNASGKPYYGRYSNWAAGQPSDSAATLDCAAISASDGTWRTHACNDALNVLCVRNMRAVPTYVGLDPNPKRSCEVLGNCQGPNDFPACTPLATEPWACTEGPEKTCDASDAVAKNLHTCDDCTQHCTDATTCATTCKDACAAVKQPSAGATCRNLSNEYQTDASCTVDRVQLLNNKLVPCSANAQCAAGNACGHRAFCSTDGVHAISPQSFCEPPTAAQVKAGKYVSGCGNNAVCIDLDVCGVPDPSCPTQDNSSDSCLEYDTCLPPGEQIQATPPANIAELTTTQVLDPTTTFKVPDEPTTNVTQYPVDGPCADGSNNCTPANDSTHAWCTYASPGQLNARHAPEKALPSGNVSGSGVLTFQFEPNFNLQYTMNNGPLGLPLPWVSANAEAKASADIHIFEMSDTLSILDVGFSASAGVQTNLRPDDAAFDATKDVCGLKYDAKAVLLGVDVLPSLLDKPVGAIPDTPTQTKCVQALRNVTEGVDRLRKALADARELVTQYKALNGVAFGDGTGTAKSLCSQIASDPPHDFPHLASGTTCDTERPEATINRFILYYNDIVRAELQLRTLYYAQQIDSWDQSAITIGGPEQHEELTIFNQNFMIGPVPVNLEVDLPLTYGVKFDVVPQFAIGQVVTQLVFGGNSAPGTPFAQIGIDGTPHAGAGITLFAGVGLDLGFAAAKLGIQGAIDLGDIQLPARGSAGLGVGVEPDNRALPLEWSPFLAPGAPLIPTQKLKFSLLYDASVGFELANVLSGELDASLKLKFFFFSVNYNKRIIGFNGFCAGNNREPWCKHELFNSGNQSMYEWGSLQMPVPFAPLAYLPVPTGKSALPTTATVSTARVSQFFYDGFCGCVQVSVPPAPPNSCWRDADCCGNAVCVSVSPPKRSEDVGGTCHGPPVP